jgi:hypothetical protein
MKQTLAVPHIYGNPTSEIFNDTGIGCTLMQGAPDSEIFKGHRQFFLIHRVPQPRKYLNGIGTVSPTYRVLQAGKYLTAQASALINTGYSSQ